MRQEMASRIMTAILCIGVLFGILLPLKSAAQVYESILRVHVVANSDTEQDQSIKMKVRDQLLAMTQEGLSNCKDLAEAKSYLSLNQLSIQRELNSYLRGLGAQYQAELKLETEYHNEKTYEDVTLPAGEYLSLRIILGAGAGQNFFCVLFPPICKNASTKPASEILISYGFSDSQMQILKPSGERSVQFKVAELWKKLFA